MKASHCVVLLTLLFIQTSCKKNDQAQPSQPTPEIHKEEYTISSIEYTAIPGYNTEEIVEQRPNLEYSNRSNSQQKIVVDPADIFEKSLFKKDAQQDYTISASEQTFSVPLDIYKDQISLGPKKWMYTEQESKLLTSLNFKDSVYVEPGKKLFVNLSITYRKIQTLYVARLKEKTSGKSVSLTGTWTGVYPLRKTMTYTTQNL